MSAKHYATLESYDLQIFDLSDIANIFAQYTKNSDVILLSGRVGAGKTEFARFIIKAKAMNENFDIDEVSSPTFSLVQTYEFRDCKISHIDLYRVNSEMELFELGIPDDFIDQITLLEWPEILETRNLSRYVSIKMQEAEKIKDHRDFKIEFFGDSWDHLIRALLENRHFNPEKK